MACQCRDHAGAIDALHPVETLCGVTRLVALQMTDQMPFDRQFTQGVLVRCGFLNVVFTECTLAGTDRKSVVQGKSVYVRVALGGRRIIKKQKKTKNQTHTKLHKIEKNRK